MAFKISSDATITYQPGWYGSKAYTSGDGFYNQWGELIFSGHYAIPADDFHSGYLTFATSGGAMSLDGDKGKREISFSAGKSPSVTPTTATKTFLVNTGSTATQNFAFDMDEEDI